MVVSLKRSIECARVCVCVHRGAQKFKGPLCATNRAVNFHFVGAGVGRAHVHGRWRRTAPEVLKSEVLRSTYLVGTDVVHKLDETRVPVLPKSR